ncbi:MAG: hypothetical protein ETSY1_03560 [Candidatus Entotheonella factor]|uniref:Twin-arginine translocation pathway signal n=1 Tax=Entotheonella factor TaxID=1429438 RepID=W4LWF2_ENTF1|nr:DUF1501 domain-containing protein [Candidatus Entotheonella palauensis]ETX02434.1 MAG: hypothetical protein ETSY1_03560 [Candidatus Entotheonella factor]
MRYVGKSDHNMTRRHVIQAGLYGLGLSAASTAALPAWLPQTSLAAADESASRPRILVVLELSGGNDGLNTLVPYGDDAYYRHRPKLGIRPEKLRRIDDHFGFSRGMAGFERLYKDGKMAIVHGCGYDNPSFSHFVSMAYWHTAAPNSGAQYGWVGRLADAMQPGGAPNYVVNIDATQSLAVSSREHTPVVFDDPGAFARKGFFQQRAAQQHMANADAVANPTQRFLRNLARSAKDASALVRQAWDDYHTPVDYGILPLDLHKVASLIAADMPTRLYYVAFRNNAFDTHVYQANLHARLLTYTSDAVAAFIQDLERIGRADDVAMLIFSEFGRRVPENTNLGTDHGTANSMYVVGKPIKGGHYGELPSLTELDEGDNLIYTTDFRRVYASVIQGWLGYRDTRELLHGEFEPFDMFG